MPAGGCFAVPLQAQGRGNLDIEGVTICFYFMNMEKGPKHTEQGDKWNFEGDMKERQRVPEGGAGRMAAVTRLASGARLTNGKARNGAAELTTPNVLYQGMLDAMGVSNGGPHHEPMELDAARPPRRRSATLRRREEGGPAPSRAPLRTEAGMCLPRKGATRAPRR